MSEQNDQRDFGAILAEFEATHAKSGGKDPKPGSRVSGTILSIGEEAAFVDIGAKSDAAVALTELTDEEGALTVAVGDTVEGMISGRDEASGCLVLRVRPGGSGFGGDEVALEEIAQARDHGIPVEGMVTEAIKGGVQVDVSGVRAFCPISQLDLRFVEDAATYVGRRLTFAVTRFEAAGRGGRPNVVLSRRELLEEEERKRREETMARLSVGAVVRGTVTSVTSYGAFVDLGGVEGLLHVSEMGYSRIEDPKEILSAGDVVEVKILAIEEQEGRDGKTRRISLSTKALQKDPWEAVAERFPVGSTVSGRVTRLEPYGAFVEIAPGLDGLVHVSEMAIGRRVAHPRDVVALGQDVEVRVLDVDPIKRRVSLSLASPVDAADTPSAAEYSGEAKGSAGGFGSLAAAFQKAKKDED